MTESRPPLRRSSVRAEQIPITWVAPERSETAPKLVIWLAPGLMEMASVEPVLERLAHAGYLAVSFDSWGRGSRCRESPDTLMPRAAANFPLVAWPFLGHGALEVLRVADWAGREFAAAPPFAVGGNSLGGDIAVAAAGLGPRIGCVATTSASRPTAPGGSWRRSPTSTAMQRRPGSASRSIPTSATRPRRP